MKLGAKLILVAALPAMLASVGLGAYSAAQQAASLRAAFERRGETLARTISEQLGSGLDPDGDLRAQLDAVLAPLWEEEGLTSVEILSLGEQSLARRVFQALPEDTSPFVCKRPLLSAAAPDDPIREVVGLVVVSIDPSPVLQESEAAYRASLWLALLVGGLASLLAILLSRLLVKPLRRLTAATQQIEGGMYEVSVSSHGDDELAVLSRSFSQMARSITERDAALRENRDALEAQAGELSVLAKSLQEALRAREILEANKEALSDMIVHDLKSPLSAITSAAQLLLDSVAREDRFFVEGMLSRTRTLLGMIQDLLTIRRMEESNLPLLPSRFDLVELSQGVVADMTPLAKEAGFRFDVEGENLPVQADKQLISRVLENLLSNALKYHRPPKPISIRAYAEQGGVRVDVIDSGKGIPEKHHRLIFERFHQVMNAGATERQGTGLGLTFCRMALEAHHGKIWVESKDGQGTRFSFWLPQKIQVVF